MSRTERFTKAESRYKKGRAAVSRDGTGGGGRRPLTTQPKARDYARA